MRKKIAKEKNKTKNKKLKDINNKLNETKECIEKNEKPPKNIKNEKPFLKQIIVSKDEIIKF